MKTMMCALCAVAALTGLADATAKNYANYAETRRYCVSRVVENGKVITTWHRNGRPDWILPSVETNTLKNIAGQQQNNPLQNQIVKLTDDLKDLNEQLQAEVVKYLTASNRAAVAEARVASAKSGLLEERETWQAKYDKASAILKPVYKLGLDLIDSILAKLEALMEQK